MKHIFLVLLFLVSVSASAVDRNDGVPSSDQIMTRPPRESEDDPIPAHMLGQQGHPEQPDPMIFFKRLLDIDLKLDISRFGQRSQFLEVLSADRSDVSPEAYILGEKDEKTSSCEK